MRTPRSLLLLSALLGLFLGGGPAARAQTPLGQPSLDEAKVQIWCATARYVYADAGRPRLAASLRCEGGNLAALAASLRPDSLRIYTLLYAPIEGRGRIYRGLKDNPARLAALTKAIVSKLGASAARQRDPARLAALQMLEKRLTDYVQTGLPPTDPTPAPEAGRTAVALSGPAEAAETSAAPGSRGGQPGAAGRGADSSGSVLPRLFAPLALILSLLSLVLYALLRQSLTATLRQLRRDVMPLPYAELTTAQRQEVDELITQRLAETAQAARVTQPAQTAQAAQATRPLAPDTAAPTAANPENPTVAGPAA